MVYLTSVVFDRPYVLTVDSTHLSEEAEFEKGPVWEGLRKLGSLDAFLAIK